MAFKWLYLSWIDARPYYKHIKVKDVDEKEVFIKEVESIKHRMKVINNLVDAGILSDIQLRNNIHVWLKICHDFKEKWGSSRVPSDIRIAVNNTRAEFNYDLVDFGVDEGAFVNNYCCHDFQHLHI